MTRLLSRARPVRRFEIEDTIEALIALLDELDGDPDLEMTGDEFEPCGDDEPCLGAPEVFPDLRLHNFDQRWWAKGGDDDRESDMAEDGIADRDALELIIAEFERPFHEEPWWRAIKRGAL